MSAVASFVLECAKSGRWARGLMVLRGIEADTSAETREACLRLAAAAAPHHWQSALALLARSTERTVTDTALVAETLDRLSRSAACPRGVHSHAVASELQRASGIPAKQAALFCAGTAWVSSRTAHEVHQTMSTGAQEAAVLDRLRSYEALRASHHTYGWEARGTAPAQATREHLRNRLVASLRPLPTAVDVAHVLRYATWPLASLEERLVSPTVALSALGPQQLTEELVQPYLRCVGLCAPQQWQEALARVRAAQACGAVSQASAPPSLLLWVAARGCWKGALALLPSLPLDNEMERRRVEDVLARSAVPEKLWRVVLHPASEKKRRPSLRLPQPTRRALAQALAAGHDLHDVQLSELMRSWASHGHWQEALALYWRIPNPEFQRRAAKALLEVRPALRKDGGGPATASDIAAVLCAGRFYPACLCTHVLYELIRASQDGVEALALARRAVQHGATYTPQVLSALMDREVSGAALRELIKGHPTAANDGIMQRLKKQYGLSL